MGIGECYEKKSFYKERDQFTFRKSFFKSASSKGITYTDEFKEVFITENEKGKLPREIFEQCGFDINVIGRKRMQSSADRWRAAYRENGLVRLCDTRKGNSGRPSDKELSLEEKYARLEAQNNLLKAENELLKKIRFAERGIKKIK